MWVLLRESGISIHFILAGYAARCDDDDATGGGKDDEDDGEVILRYRRITLIKRE